MRSGGIEFIFFFLLVFNMYGIGYFSVVKLIIYVYVIEGVNGGGL